MKLRHSVRFILNDQMVELDSISPHQTLLDFLRLDRALKGTKEGCAEGDCGACTVLVGKLDGAGQLAYQSINACIRFVASLDATHVVTVEHLSAPMGPLHPVQQAMVDHHGSQCGFCTPGFVMSLYGQWLTTLRPSVADVETALQGNLCRCTGYASILRAAQSISDHADPALDRLNAERVTMAQKLMLLEDDARIVVETDGHRAILPATADDLATVLSERPGATLVSGATDVGLWVTKFMHDLPDMVFLHRVRELQSVAVEPGRLVVGAGVSYTNATDLIATHIPALRETWHRIGGAQVRNAGTIGGNIANGSPIGDTPPALIALGASIVLRSAAGRREVLLEDYFIAYGRQDRQPDEFVESVAIPLPAADDIYAVHKVTKRFDEDISSVLGAFHLRVEDGVVRHAVIAYGGMAATPKRAGAMEAALLGQPWSRASVEAAMACCDEDFTPLSDWRASAAYRMTVAKNLLLRVWAESANGQLLQVRSLVDG
jgi:xanthine dehydrogenase small subunit